MSFFCHWIGVKSVQIAGIIAEYNPLHMGHAHLMERARAALGPETAVLCVMSGDFVQRGDFALVRRQARAAAAVDSGADLVLELPLPWAAAPAERFAAGGVALLEAAGVVTHLVFGSECGDAGPLREVAACLDTPAFHAGVRCALDRGMSYAACRQTVVGDLLGPDRASLLSAPNNILGIEYCKALLRQGSAIRPLALRREGAPHDGAPGVSGPASASFIRRLLREGRREEALAWMAPAMRTAYEIEEAAGRAPVFWETCERAILARLRSMGEADFAPLDEGREGLYRRLYDASRAAASTAEVLETAKTKRYPYARLRRMVLWAYLGLPPGDTPAAPPYLRVLAANGAGRGLLARMRETARVPVLTKPADVRQLGAGARRLFAAEARAADLYALAFPNLRAAAGGSAWREGPVIR